jgi:hypothetical protein
VTALLQDGQWIEIIYKWCVHLHCQEKLIMDMNGEMCPKKTNQWAHFDATLKFYISRQRKIIKHTDAHSHFKSPSTKWWTITLAVAPTISEINKTIVQLQNRSLIIVQQKIKIGLLKDLLIRMFKIKGIIKIDDDEEDIGNKFYVDGNWCVEH